MKTRTTLTLTLAAAAALCAVFAAPTIPRLDGPVAPAFAQDKPDLMAEWQNGWKTAHKNAAAEWNKIFKFCQDKSLEDTGNLTRRRVFKWEPENEEVRKYFGYTKQADGKWVQTDEKRLSALREAVDIDDPKATDYQKKVLAAEKKIRDSFKALAQKAKKNGDAEPARAAEWKEKEKSAWWRVLDAENTNEEAHKALGHEKFEGRYYSPFAMPFAKARKVRKDAGVQRAGMDFAVGPTGVDGVAQASGLSFFGAKSKHFTVLAMHGQDNAIQCAKWSERALEDFVKVYALDESFRESLPIRRFNLVKEKPDMEKLLKAEGQDPKQIARFLEIFAGTGFRDERATITEGQADAHDHCMHYTGHACAAALAHLAAAEYGAGEGREDWITEALAYDITRRLSGTTLTTCGAFGKYGNNMTPKPNQDLWIELARLQVDNDDDVALSRLYRCKMAEQQLRGPETVKGYAFIQFLFEKDLEKAREFVKRCLAQGTPTAVKETYDLDLDTIDAQYREWILKSW